MAKLIIECNTNGEAFEVLENILCAIGESKFQAFKNSLNEAEREDFEKAIFYNREFKKLEKLGRQIKNHARVEL